MKIRSRLVPRMWRWFAKSAKSQRAQKINVLVNAAIIGEHNFQDTHKGIQTHAHKFILLLLTHPPPLLSNTRTCTHADWSGDWPGNISQLHTWFLSLLSFFISTLTYTHFHTYFGCICGAGISSEVDTTGIILDAASEEKLRWENRPKPALLCKCCVTASLAYDEEFLQSRLAVSTDLWKPTHSSRNVWKPTHR
jgi:hypothetical protein